jgi:hypothetical protein
MATKSTATATPEAVTITAAEFCLQFNAGCKAGLTRGGIRMKMGLKKGNFASRERQYRKGLEGTDMQLLKPKAAPKGGRAKNDYAAIAAALKAQAAVHLGEFVCDGHRAGDRRAD